MTIPSGTIQASGSSVTSWQEQPLLRIRKLVLAFLQGLFGNAETGYFRWQPSLEDTEIIITDETPIQLEVVGIRPAISIVRGTVAWNRTSLDTMQTIDSRTGQKKHTDLVSGTIIVNCCSKVSLESERIAWIVASHCWLLRSLVMKHTPVHEFGQGLQISAPSPAGAIVSGDSDETWINTTIPIPYFMQVYGKVTPLNQQVLSEIEANISVELGAQTGFTRDQQIASARTENVAVRPPSIRGRPIRQIALMQQLSVKES